MVQAGAELIGSSDALACAEMVSLGVRALNLAGIAGLTVDIGIPHLFDVIVGECAPDIYDALADALRLRDSDAIAQVAHDKAAHLAEVIQASG